jgi:hypothetical protein
MNSEVSRFLAEIVVVAILGFAAGIVFIIIATLLNKSPDRNAQAFRMMEKTIHWSGIVAGVHTGNFFCDFYRERTISYIVQRDACLAGVAFGALFAGLAMWKYTARQTNKA